VARGRTWTKIGWIYWTAIIWPWGWRWALKGAFLLATILMAIVLVLGALS
jgi:hypothetical protein